ncbi:MAG: gamma-glutamyl-gamma-aminobutyrate hydrolase family protein [Clostridia bacterium]|nr:gamma-glutamyl-gamma-aminobutyrate hydrolase family protein [Clostridia bacterium]
MAKPIILLTPGHEDGDDKLYMKFSYVDAIIKAGAVPLIAGLDTDEDYISTALASVHGLLLTGGDDIDPSIFGEEKSDKCGPVSDLRDLFELRALKLALEYGMPVLGICRGAQVMNVALGGTLYQDMPGHRQSGAYHEPHHSVTVTEPLSEIYPEHSPVNSFHHQAIKKQANGLRVCAESDDGYIEGVYMPGHPFFVGVQWHPERMIQTDAAARRLFEKFTHECTAYKMKGKKND